MTVEMSARIGAMIVALAKARGVEPDDLRAATGFSPETLANPDGTISLELEAQLWNEAAARTRDDAFGIHAGELVQPGVFDVLDYATRTAPSLRAALERLIRYNRLVHDAAVFALRESEQSARIEHWFRVASAKQCRHSAEFVLVALLVVMRQATGRALRPLAVELRTDPPPTAAARAELERVLGVAPRFSAAMDVIELERSELDAPLLGAEPALSRVILAHAEALLKSRPLPAEHTSERVRRVLLDMLGKEGATLAHVAERLRMSERSLQRRLAEEALTFDGVLDDLRRELALRYLAEPKLAIAEVAYLLGYSEPSPFHRAFKRWTGKTPSQARQPARDLTLP